ncbi:methyl-accepting chemotaxis protein [Selenihalanaerobacter shriftii]|uniref:Methyl-accepting chemotaxis sensory transducer with Cache sensor n=1 Tax=Selenihalanaerobacter shriftii TaxID=142842 RepID=A0A1T4LDV8_9FIRM|nr:methyl-accepting chemotaxis protein [Selenihalanaerobacter shriftii]SJZ52796.1 methyl-accepting chemotaxis sensory transducer with Cache sensor [Selenihalanaerobacter shriftii]
MFKSIRAKMMIIIGVVILVLIVGSSLIAYNQARGILSQSLFKAAEESAQQNAKVISTWIKAKKNDMKLLSQLNSIKSMDWDKQYLTLKKLLKEAPASESLFVVDLNGKMHDTNNYSTNVSNQSYFQRVMQEKKIVVSKILSSFETGRPITIIATPIHKDGQMVGILGNVLKLDKLQQITEDMKINGIGYGWIIDSNKQTIAHPNDKYLGNKKILETGDKQLKNITSQMAEGKAGSGVFMQEGVGKGLAFAPIEETNWSIALVAVNDKVLAPVNAIKKSSLWISLVAIILGLIVAYLISSKIAKPIQAASNFAEEIANGNLQVQSLDITSNDEVGELISSLNRMRNNLKDMITDLLNTTENLSAYSEELSASAQEGNAVIETSNESIKEMTASIQQISASSQQVTGVAQKANSKTKAGSEKVANAEMGMKQINQKIGTTVNTISSLDDKSQEIGQIIELINDIAEQTNLLALNAAIEAARAGEHGQGFAVVAEEIRELAEETAKATDEIANLVKETQNKSDSSLKAINQVEDEAKKGEEIAIETGEIFTEIKSSIEETTAYIQQTAASTQDLAENSDEVMNATQDINNMSEEVTKSSQELASMAQELKDLVERFDV